MRLLYTLTIAGAAVAAVLLWWRFIDSVQNNPPPPQVITVTEGSEVLPAETTLFCYGPAFGAGAVIWRNCAFEDRGQNVMVLYDLQAGTAAADWVFPEIYELSEIDALRQLPDGDLLVVKSSFEGAALFHMHQDGGVSNLYTFPPATRTAGLEMVDGAAELVTYDGETATVLRITDDDMQTLRVVDALPCRESDRYCWLSFARHQEGEWTFISLRVVDQQEMTATAEIITTDADGKTLNTQTVTLEAVTHYEANPDGSLTFSQRVLERSTGNLTTNRYVYQPYVPQGADWELFQLPPEVEPQTAPFESMYLLHPDRLEWIPRLETAFMTYQHRIDGRWLVVQITPEDVRIFENGDSEIDQPSDAASGSAFTEYHTLMPGYWFIEDPYLYIRLSDDLQRQDAPTLQQRINRLFGDYHPGDPLARHYGDRAGFLQFGVLFVLLYPVIGAAIVGGAALVQRARVLPVAAVLALVYLAIVFLIREDYLETIIYL